MKKTWGFLRGARLSFGMAALLAAGLTGCLRDERVAGGDDIPNAVEPLGRRAAEDTRDTSSWNAHGEAPQSAPGVYDSARVPESAPQSGAPKRGAAVLLSLGAEIGFDLPGTERLLDVITEPLTGLLRAVRVQTATGFRAEDTTWYRPDSLGAPRLVRVSGHARSGGETRYSVFEDGDGDGLLSPRGAGSAALARFITVRASGEREESAMRMRAGPDGSFATRGDNGLAALTKTVVLGLDTLISLILTDADGDGLVYNPLRDSNKVEVTRRARSGGVQTSLAYRVAVFRDSARNYAYRYRRVTSGPRGVDTVVALGPDSLPDFAREGSGFTRAVFRSGVSGDTLAAAEHWYAVALAPTGNRLVEAKREKSFRFGTVTRTTYRIKPASPAPAGGFARTGSLQARAELAGGGWIALDGVATSTEISGAVTDSEGRSGTARFDLNGKIKAVSGF